MLDNHLHNLVYLDPRRAKRWSKAEVLRRWARLHPPRGPDRKPLKSIDQWVRENIRNRKLVRELRKRLSDLGWFMKELKEPLARKANEEDGVRGPFWAGRYKSIAVLGEEAVLATCAYIDLNPLAAGMVRLPEEALYTSLRTRLVWCARQGRLPDLQAAWQGAVAAVRRLQGSERGLWLCPLEDRRAQGEARVGVLDGFSLGSYLRLVDATSRLVRSGKAARGAGSHGAAGPLETDLGHLAADAHPALYPPASAGRRLLLRSRPAPRRRRAPPLPTRRQPQRLPRVEDDRTTHERVPGVLVATAFLWTPTMRLRAYCLASEPPPRR